MAWRANECLFGWYRGFLGDGDSTTGSVLAQINAVETILGGGVIQAAVIGGGINASLTGLGSRHLFVHVPLIPNGGSLHTAATTGYATMWTKVVTDLNAQSRNTADTTLQIAWEGSGSNSWGGVNTVDPATGVLSTRSDWVAAYRNAVDTMRSAGLNSGVTLDWNVMTNGLSGTQLALMDPGGNYRHSVGWDGYYGNPDPGTYARTDAAGIWANEMLRDLNTVTTYARANGLRAGMGEFGWIQPIPGDTSSNAYTYRPAPSVIFETNLYNYLKANADIWAFANRFGQNQYSAVDGTGKAPISEDNQPIYLGTNPTSQTYPYTRNTSSTGPAYLTNSPQWTPVILDSFLDNWSNRAGRGGGTLLYTTPPPPPPPVASVVASGRVHPLRNRRGWIKA